MGTKTVNYNLIYFIIGSVLFFSLYWWTFNIGLTHDSLSFRVAGTLPQAKTLSYWIEIFTSPNNGPQYRPLGFFGYFFLTQQLFEDNIIAYRLLTFGLYTLTLLLTWIAAIKLTASRMAASLSFLFLAIHYGWTFPIIDISCVAKYLFTVLFLVWGINITIDKSRSYHGKAFKLILISIVSIFCMEGALFFPVVFVLFAFTITNNLKDLGLISLSLLPTVGYLICRLFLWEVPSSGFMKVNFSEIPILFSFLVSEVWIPTPLNFVADFSPQLKIKALVGLVVILALLFLITQLKRKERKIALLLLASSLLLLLPFSPLSNHVNGVYLKGTLWSLIPASLLFGKLVKELLAGFNHLFARSLIWGVTLLMFCTFLVQNRRVAERESAFFSTTIKNQQNFTEEIRRKMTSQACESPILIEDTNSVENLYAFVFDFEHLNLYLIPALLSYTFPDHEFFIPKKALKTRHNFLGILIKEGGYWQVYKTSEEIRLEDRFGHSHTVSHFDFHPECSITVEEQHWVL